MIACSFISEYDYRMDRWTVYLSVWMSYGEHMFRILKSMDVLGCVETLVGTCISIPTKMLSLDEPSMNHLLIIDIECSLSNTAILGQRCPYAIIDQ